jgi:hypothetical protein
MIMKLQGGPAAVLRRRRHLASLTRESAGHRDRDSDWQFPAASQTVTQAGRPPAAIVRVTGKFLTLESS